MEHLKRLFFKKYYSISSEKKTGSVSYILKTFVTYVHERMYRKSAIFKSLTLLYRVLQTKFQNFMNIHLLSLEIIMHGKTFVYPCMLTISPAKIILSKKYATINLNNIHQHHEYQTFEIILCTRRQKRFAFCAPFSIENILN